jgi:cholesterol transport system auxiliary component
MNMQSSRERERRPGAIGRREAVGRTAGLTLLTTLAACGVLPRYNEPVDLYTLTPKTTFPESLPHVDWQLVVETPVTAASFDTPRIALQRTPLTFEYYANAAWTDNAPSMVQTLLIESFESTRKIGAVGREAIGLRPDFVLKTDLREFEAVYDGTNPAPTVWVRMNAKLVRMPERRIVASETREAKVLAGGGKITDIVAAFDDALGRVLKEIVAFTMTTLSRTAA